MTDELTVRLDAAFVLAVTGAGLTPWPWLALIVGAAFYLGNAILIDRRTPTEPKP